MTGQRPPPTTSKYQRHGASFHGSPVDASMRSDDRSCARTGSSPCAISARTSVGDTPRIVDAVPLDERPQPVGAGEVGRAVVEHERAAVRERADDLPRPHDPADVGEPEQALARPQVGLERDLFGDLDEEAAVHVHRALGPAGRAARVRDEQRVLAVDRDRVEPVGLTVGQLVEREVASRLSSARRRVRARHDDDGVHRSAPARPRRRRSPSSARRLPRRVKPSAVIERDRARVVEPDRDRVGAVAGEDRQEDRAELRDREQRGDRLGDHRQEQADRVARAHAPRGAARPRSDRSAVRSSAHGQRADRRLPRLPRRSRQRRPSPDRRRARRRTSPRGCSVPPVNHLAHGMPSVTSSTSVYGVANGVEEAHDRVPEPLGLVDRPRARGRRRSRCPRSAMNRATLLSRSSSASGRQTTAEVLTGRGIYDAAIACTRADDGAR